MGAWLSSCSLPEAGTDVQRGLRKAGDVAEDTWLAARQKFDETFDPNTNDLHDPKGGLSRRDYEEYFFNNPPPIKDVSPQHPVLPDVSKLMVAPKPPVVARDKLVTVSVTQDVPLKEVLIELARRVDVDVEIDPTIEGGIIFRAKDRPFSEVIERITALSGLRYSVNDGVLRIEKDTPYIISYNLDYVNINRESTSSAKVGGGLKDTGSTASITSDSKDSDIWAVVEEGVDNIIATGGGGEDKTSGGGGGGESSRVIKMNRQAGTITVAATQRQHQEIKNYLDMINLSITSQVLIEAKVVEVSLDDEYRGGIKWDFLNSNLTEIAAGLDFRPGGVDGGTVFSIASPATELLGIDNTSLDAIVELVQRFGTTRTLSNPRINAMNNQLAVLSFVEKVISHEITIEENTESTSTGTDTQLTINSTKVETPEGVILVIQPSINLQKNEIIMSVRPTISRVTQFVNDPGVALEAARQNVSISSPTPQTETRELDTVLRIKSGEVMVIGGLIEEKNSNMETGVPGLSKIPWVGHAFKQKVRNTQVVETVIFIKATIVPGHGVAVEDKEFYRNFVGGRNQFTF